MTKWVDFIYGPYATGITNVHSTTTLPQQPTALVHWAENKHSSDCMSVQLFQVSSPVFDICLTYILTRDHLDTTNKRWPKTFDAVDEGRGLLSVGRKVENLNWSYFYGMELFGFKKSLKIMFVWRSSIYKKLIIDHYFHKYKFIVNGKKVWSLKSLTGFPENKRFGTITLLYKV